MTKKTKQAQESEGKLSPFLAGKRYSNVAKLVDSNDTVLDIGCGVGGLEEYLPPNTNYYGIDSVKRWEKDKGNLFKVNVGDQLPAEIQNAHITVVTALALIEHLDNPGILLLDASKILPKGGKLIVTTPHPIAEKIHHLGARIGLFSAHADEEHEDLLDKSHLESLAAGSSLKLTEYRRFLFRLNQVAVYIKQ